MITPGHKQTTQPESTRAGWRIEPWCADIGCKRSYAYELIKKNEIESVKLGGMRVITTPPREYLAKVRQQQAGTNG